MSSLSFKSTFAIPAPVLFGSVLLLFATLTYYYYYESEDTYLTAAPTAAMYSNLAARPAHSSSKPAASSSMPSFSTTSSRRSRSTYSYTTAATTPTYAASNYTATNRTHAVAAPTYTTANTSTYAAATSALRTSSPYAVRTSSSATYHSYGGSSAQQIGSTQHSTAQSTPSRQSAQSTTYTSFSIPTIAYARTNYNNTNTTSETATPTTYGVYAASAVAQSNPRFRYSGSSASLAYSTTLAQSITDQALYSSSAHRDRLYAPPTIGSTTPSTDGTSVYERWLQDYFGGGSDNVTEADLLAIYNKAVQSNGAFASTYTYNDFLAWFKQQNENPDSDWHFAKLPIGEGTACLLFLLIAYFIYKRKKHALTIN